VALSVVIASDVVTFVVDVLEIRLMDDVRRGELEFRLGDDLERLELAGLSRLQADDLRQGIAAGLYFVAFVLAAVFFILWLHRAYSNLPALGVPKRRFDSNAAIWPWFVPILNLWRPKQVANDVWRGSNPAVASRELNLVPGPVPALLGFWWAGYIVTNALAGRAARLWWDTPTAEDAGYSALQGDTSGADSIRAAASLELVAVCVDLVAAILAILVIRQLTARQLERERVVERLPAASPA
jgi:hypothetical protein